MEKLLKLLATSSLFFGFYSIPAQAGWQYTEWGMSPNEVIAASGNKIENKFYNDYAGSPNLGKNLNGVYIFDDIEFSLKIVFDKQNKLDNVVLDVSETKKCKKLLKVLLNIYGNTVDSNLGIFSKLNDYFHDATWQDVEHDNLINFTAYINDQRVAPAICFITYKKLIKPNEKGGL